VEAMHGRLNRLLAQEPVESPYEEDASRLVASWIESCKSDQIASSSARQQDHASWFDFVIVTGEKQVLLNQGSWPLSFSTSLQITYYVVTC